MFVCVELLVGEGVKVVFGKVSIIDLIYFC